MQLAGHQTRFSGRFQQRPSASLDRRINAGTHEVSSSPSQSQKTDPIQIRIKTLPESVSCCRAAPIARAKRELVGELDSK